MGHPIPGKGQFHPSTDFQVAPLLLKLLASGQLSELIIPTTANMTMMLPTSEEVKVVVVKNQGPYS
jgi:hypothetical protein